MAHVSLPVRYRTALSLLPAMALLIGLTGSSPAAAEEIPRSSQALPVAGEVERQLDLDAITPDELLAGGLAQYGFFFPAGAGTQLTGRAQLDALMSTAVLIEAGLRRGGGGYEHAHALFECYVLMYGAGRSGLAADILGELPEPGTESSELVTLYRGTLEALEAHGRQSAFSLGELLLLLRPERTDVAYFLAHMAEEEGDIDSAAAFYARGVAGERFASRLATLSNLQELAGIVGAETTREQALYLNPELADDEEAEARRLTRRRLETLRRRVDRGDDSEAERSELAGLYRAIGRPRLALDTYDTLADWDDAPPELVEEHAIAAMEANSPARMVALAEATRGQANPSSRLLQIRIVARSADVFRGAMEASESQSLATILAADALADVRDDLAALEAIEPGRARFLEVYLGLMMAMGELGRTQTLSDERVAELDAAIASLLDERPDDASVRRFELLLALYDQEPERLERTLRDHLAFCGRNDCVAESRRIAVTMTLQLAVNLAEPELLDRIEGTVDDLAEDLPIFAGLAAGSIALTHAALSRPSEAEREALQEEARAALRAAAEAIGDSDEIGSYAELMALFNSLAFLALEARDVGAARLYLEGARRYQAMQPVLLINLGVALASGQNFNDAFVTFGLGAAETLSDPPLAFQCLRWAGHIYSLAGHRDEAAGAWAQALALFEGGGSWTGNVDDGLAPGWPLEWGLIYDDDDGLSVALELGAPPLFFVPAPVSVLEMSATADR